MCAVCSGNPVLPGGNGNFSCSPTTPFGATCAARCNIGFTGAPNATCRAGGLWQAVQGTCQQIGECPPSSCWCALAQSSHTKLPAFPWLPRLTTLLCLFMQSAQAAPPFQEATATFSATSQRHMAAHAQQHATPFTLGPQVPHVAWMGNGLYKAHVLPPVSSTVAGATP